MELIEIIDTKNETIEIYLDNDIFTGDNLLDALYVQVLEKRKIQ